METIIGKKGETFHGTIIRWVAPDEFIFLPGHRGLSHQFWCKTDYWRLAQPEIMRLRIVEG